MRFASCLTVLLLVTGCASGTEPRDQSEMPIRLLPETADSTTQDEARISFAEALGSLEGRLNIRAVVYAGLGCDELSAETDGVDNVLSLKIVAQRLRPQCLGTGGYEIYGLTPRRDPGTYRVIVTYVHGAGTVERLFDRQVELSDAPGVPIEGDHWR